MSGAQTVQDLVLAGEKRLNKVLLTRRGYDRDSFFVCLCEGALFWETKKDFQLQSINPFLQIVSLWKYCVVQTAPRGTAKRLSRTARQLGGARLGLVRNKRSLPESSLLKHILIFYAIRGNYGSRDAIRYCPLILEIHSCGSRKRCKVL